MAKNILKFTATGIVLGLALGWLLSLVSGNTFVVLFIGTIGLLVAGVLGIVHRNDPWTGEISPLHQLLAHLGRKSLP